MFSIRSHPCVMISPTSINILYENIKSISRDTFMSPSWKCLSKESGIIFEISKVLAPWRLQRFLFYFGNNAYTRKKDIHIYKGKLHVLMGSSLKIPFHPLNKCDYGEGTKKNTINENRKHTI